MGAAFAPSVLLMILSAIVGFILAVTTPARAGSEMGGGFIFPLFLVFGAISSLILYIASCVIFLIWGLSPKLFWWVTLAPNALLLFVSFLMLLANITA